MRLRLATLLFVLLCAPAFAGEIYYVRATDGDNSDHGLSVAKAWATLQYAADTATASAYVHICADSTHTQTAKVDFDTVGNEGGDNTPITFRGVNADGTDDGTVAAIQAGAAFPAATDLIDLNLMGNNLIFENLRFTSATNRNIVVQAAEYQTFIKCTIDSAGGDGFQNRVSTAISFFYACHIYGNQGWGLSNMDAASRRIGSVNWCSIHDNGGGGVQVAGAGLNYYHVFSMANSLVYDNGSDGLALRDTIIGAEVFSCTFFGNTGDGIDLEGANVHNTRISRCIFRSNGGYGINMHGGTIRQISAFFQCGTNNNTSGHTDINGGSFWGANHVTTDPGFVSETDGSEDLTPTTAGYEASWNYFGGGTTYGWIGAIQPQDSTGGAVQLVGGGLVQ